MRFLSAIFLTVVIGWSAEPLRVGLTRMPVSAAIVLAQEMGLFKKAGLNVEVHEYSLGKLALEDMSAGKLDIACAAVTPLVHKGIVGDEFRIISTAATSTGMVALAARKDLGVEQIADIQGKRIGFTPGTSGEFFFETMRVLHRVPRAGLRVEPHAVEDLVPGLQDGSLDVISIWEPEIQRARNSLTNRLSLFYGSGFYTFSWNLVTLPKTIESRRGDLEKFVAVLFEAAEYIEKNPAKAAEALAEKLGARGRELAMGLTEARFRPQLGQELLVQMEGEARWIIRRDEKTNAIPNFLRCIDSSILKKVQPRAVTIIQ